MSASNAMFIRAVREVGGYCPPEKDAGIITTATPESAKTVSSKYADMGGVRVQKDSEDSHGRKISKSHIQKIYNYLKDFRLPHFPKVLRT